jgi:hypothetical protein
MEINSDEFDALLTAIENNKLSVRAATRLICGEIAVPNIPNDGKGAFRLVVDYNLSVSEMLDKAGCDDCFIGRDISILTKKNVLEILQAKLFNFRNNIASEDIIIFMKQCGYRSANFAELMAFATIYNISIDMLVVALFSRWTNTNIPQVPILQQINKRRDLFLYDYNTRWFSHCKFLGILETRVGSSSKP